MAQSLPEPFAAWFARQGWTPRPHQLRVLHAARAGRSALLIAPTGGGKTLAGFLPTLVQLHAAPRAGLHTLYVSPLKALASDIARNLMRPVSELSLPITIDTRTGDTSAETRRRQRAAPPNILLTTPESLAVLLSMPDAAAPFATLSAIVLDEVHALAGNKRGDQLSLCLARLGVLAPAARRIGLSATVAHRKPLLAYVSRDATANDVDLIEVTGGAPPHITTMLPQGRLPWSGHMGLSAAPEILARIAAAGMTLVFVNTRAQAELLFQELWKLNDATLPIAIHHGSLEPEQRRRVEQAMAEGRLRAVVATSSLDLGIDWGGVDQVLQVGAPKGVSRLLQRVGRANHRMDEPSRAVLVPANRFEVLECEAAIQGVAAGELDGDAPRPGGLDVLAQHILGIACAGPFHPDALFDEVRHAAPYAALTRPDFDDVLAFVETGGYALAAYETYRKLFRDAEGRLHVRSDRIARQHRMNIGTIVEEPLLKVRYAGRGGGTLGEVEEYFVNMLTPGDTFIFAGRLLRFLGLRETVCEVADGGTGDPKVPAYAGGRMPLTTNLADRVRGMLQDPPAGALFPHRCGNGSFCRRRDHACPGAMICWSKHSRAATAFTSWRTASRAATPTRRSACWSPAGWSGSAWRRWASSPPITCWPAGRPAPARSRPPVRAGHAGRRSGGVDGGKLHAAPHLPQRRGNRRPDRAPPPGGGEVAAPGHGQFRPDLQRAAPPPARPYPAAGHPRRRRRRPDRCGADRRPARAGAGTHPAHGTLARLAAGGAGAAGDRPGERARRGRRRRAAGGGGTGG